MWLHTLSLSSATRQPASPFSGFVLIDQLCLLDKGCGIKRHRFRGTGVPHLDPVSTGLSKGCVHSGPPPRKSNPLKNLEDREKSAGLV